LNMERSATTHPDTRPGRQDGPPEIVVRLLPVATFVMLMGPTLRQTGQICSPNQGKIRHILSLPEGNIFWPTEEIERPRGYNVRYVPISKWLLGT
jgi:hypothetical protein